MTKMAISIASVVAATAKGLSALGGGSVTHHLINLDWRRRR
jgi:hypothetical protein